MPERESATKEEFRRRFLHRQEWLATIARDRRLAAGELRVGLALSLHLNMKNGALYPSAARLAESTGQTIRAVEKQIQRLRIFGLIDWDSGKGKGRSSNHYRLTLPKAEERPNSSASNTELVDGTRRELDPNSRSVHKSDDPQRDASCPEFSSDFHRTRVRSNTRSVSNSLAELSSWAKTQCTAEIMKDGRDIHILEKAAHNGQFPPEGMEQLNKIIANHGPTSPLRLRAEALLKTVVGT